MQIDLNYTVPLDDAIAPVSLAGALYAIEDTAHVIKISLTRAGQAVSPAGCTVAAYIQRSNNTTVTVTGTISDGKACVALPDSAYAIPGRITITVTLSESSQVLAALCLRATVLDTTSGTPAE